MVFPFVFLSAPCAPVNVSASLLCDNNTAAVSWQHSPSAVSYSVKAVGRDGDLKRCATNSTSCLLPNMHCSQTYIITVTPFSMRCEGRESFPYTYNAGEIMSNKKNKLDKLGFNQLYAFFKITTNNIYLIIIISIFY